jgi:dethiobiotin synthetase
MKYFVTAIGTDSGKTMVSAILCDALGLDYWKPIQSGSERDIDTVFSLTSENMVCFPEKYLLKTPESPHAAARKDGVIIDMDEIKFPKSDNLLIEGAGGLMVPLNDQDLMIDLIKKLDIPVVLVSNTYLGSINHTLLSCALLKTNNIKVAGIVFNGEENKETESIIEKRTGYPVLLRIPQLAEVSRESIAEYVKSIKKDLNEKLR